MTTTDLERLSVSLGNLHFTNPILLASGCASFGEPFEGIFDISTVGALITKAITPNPREGNPPPRICETKGGMLNSIGLQNPGVEMFANAILPELRLIISGSSKGVGASKSEGSSMISGSLKRAKIIVNVAGFSLEDFEFVIKRLSKEEGIYAFELDLSCPNVKDGTLFSTNPVLFGRTCERLRAVTHLPLIPKLSPEAGDLVPFVKIAFGAGMDGATISNTWPAMAIDAKSGRTKLKTMTGGLSGPAIKPLTVYRVYRCADALPDFPILASGGVANALDVIELIRAGALAVQLGTILFLDPSAPKKILEALPALLDEIGVSRIAHLRGKLFPP